MIGKRLLVGLMVLIAALLAVGTVLAATIDPVGRTVTTTTLYADWSGTNPEVIEDIRWNGSGNLTNTGSAGCGDPLEYFGNAWSAADSINFVSLVGWGQTGTWSTPNSKQVSITSTAPSASGCYGTLDIPVETRYRFGDHGPGAYRIQVQRKFLFGAAPFAQDFRPYIARLYPHTDYNQVYHPDVLGTTLLVEDQIPCDFGCAVTDWNDTWFAVHNPITGQGLIVRHGASAYDAVLWVDKDDASLTSSTSVQLVQPAGGFTGTVTENETLCFYDSSTWTPSLTLPPGC